MHPMDSFRTMLLAFILTLAMCASAASNECPANQEMSCESLRSSSGYTYMVPPGFPCSGDCEQGWYHLNGTFIVDSTLNAGGERLPVVVDITPENLTLSVCASLQWQLVCGKCRCFVNYNTFTDLKRLAAPGPLPGNNTSGEEQDSNDLPAWGIALIGIVVVVAPITIVFIGRRAKCFRKPKHEDVL